MKWIMVNIMDSREFACQILNRDLWSDRTVQQTIRENFYFLQVSLIRNLIDCSTHKMNLTASDIEIHIHLINILISASLIREQVSK